MTSDDCQWEVLKLRKDPAITKTRSLVSPIVRALNSAGRHCSGMTALINAPSSGADNS